MEDPEVSGDHARLTKIAKEYASLSKLIKPYLEYQALDQAIKESEELLDDPDMQAMAEEELATLRPKRDALADEDRRATARRPQRRFR